MSDRYYITTPIYYVNDAPHIGHAYTTVACDVAARFFRAMGRDTRFLTGTDEHGIKIVKTARLAGETPQQLADRVVVHFHDMWKQLGISHDDFIRTSEERHEARVREIVKRLVDRDEIYLGQYGGWYDEGQEEFVTELAAKESEYRSAISGRPLVRYEEPSYFFRLSKWVPWLIGYIEANPRFIQPDLRRNEVLSKLKAGVDDLSISRLAENLDGWGVRLPNDPSHSVYVWIDALFNYYTALGLPEIGDERDGQFAAHWPPAAHVIGKDILWFHAVYWPCMLKALDIELPRQIFAHGWWTSEGRKMSKTLGNFVSGEAIRQLCDQYGLDAFRYFLLRDARFGADGDFSRDAFSTRYHVELANGVGNLLSRSTHMIVRYFDGALPEAGELGEHERPMLERARHLSEQAEAMMGAFRFQEYLGAVQDLVTETNRYIDATEPYKLAKDDSQSERLGTILNSCAQSIRIALEWLRPFMPETSGVGLAALGLTEPASGSLLEATAWGLLPAGQKIRKAPPLFPRQG